MTIKAQLGEAKFYAPGDGEPFTAQEAIDAIRLAVSAAADDRAVLRVLEAILALAPKPDGSGTRSVNLLLKAIRDGDVKLTVAEPKGRR